MVSRKIINDENNQAICIPKEYHFEREDVYINKLGNTIVIFPEQDPFEGLKHSLSSFTKDFFSDGRNQPDMQKRDGS